MLAKRIIACLDVKDGKVVKGTNFKDLRIAGEPAELAQKYSEEGADEIVFLDIAASREKRKTRREWVRKSARTLNVPFTVGGGISNIGDIREVLELGADKIAINTAAFSNPRLLREASGRFGSQCIVSAIDAKTSPCQEVFSYGGAVPTGKNAVDWAAECQEKGAGEILLTSIDRDGTRNGFDCVLTSAVAEKLSIPVIASGGAGSPRDFLDVFSRGKADAALAAGIFHYGDWSIAEVKAYLSGKGIKVRL